ncbi:hypothetical protein DVV91_09815 [Clostridium botulinum]|uniref:hypothetical protein n=1 Tax=Clostridium TaxID=1485 RepID=UPI0013EE7E2A|nr:MULTISPECIES: hypothetical protein [Clostridium]MBN1074636.1 hypothetical protein [Clostridium botulinum]MBZ9693210.1 hypothetical protein [Clostridium sp. M14]NFT08265.1 hypothetical protein [Clostridium botulinum]
MKIGHFDYYEVNGCKVRNGHSYLKNERSPLNTTVRTDIYKELHKLSKIRKKPMSKILDCIWETFKAHPEIKNEFNKRLREY